MAAAGLRGQLHAAPGTGLCHRAATCRRRHPAHPEQALRAKLLGTRGVTALGLTTAGGQAGVGGASPWSRAGPDPPHTLQDRGGGRRKLFKLLSFPVGEAAGPGTGNPPLMQADLLGDPGKSCVPEATSLKQALVKRGCCSSTASHGCAPRHRSPGRPQGMGQAEPRVSVLEEPGTGRIGAGEQLLSPFLALSLRHGHVPAARQAHNKPPRVARVATALESGTSAIVRPWTQGRRTRTQPGSTSGAGHLPGRGKLPGEEPCPTGTQTTSMGCDPPLSAGPSPGPGAELVLPGKKKPRAEENAKGPNPHLPPPRSQDLAAAHQLFPGSCSVRRRSFPNPPIHTTTSQQGCFETAFRTFRMSTKEPEPLP